MANNKVQNTSLSKEEALSLARKGKDAWNGWAQKNPGSTVDFSQLSFSGNDSSFEGYIFPANTNFTLCSFINASFKNAVFLSGAINFPGAKFGGERTDFTEAVFENSMVSFSEADFAASITFFRNTSFLKSAKFNNAVFSGNVSFNNANFEGLGTKFINTEFLGKITDFSNARFCAGLANFRGSKFEGSTTMFQDVVFDSKNVIFSNAQFNCLNTTFQNSHSSVGAQFDGATFNSSINFERCQFGTPLDLRRTSLGAHFTLHDLVVGYSSKPVDKFKILKKASSSSDADKFRRLKELAIQIRDHDREQEYFSGELKAKRFYETAGLSLVPSYLYEWTSDFGRSLFRPVFCLLFTWLLFGLFYGVNGLQYATSTLSPLWDGLKLSLATLVPFAAVSRTAMTEAREKLFGDDVSLLMDAAMVFEGILAIAFIFLIGLALRNRFRI